METHLLFDPRCAALCGMLFTTAIALTAEAPEAVPAVFQKMWRRFQLFREARRIRSSARPGGRFWEIDMTNFEP